jgi:UDP-2,3-diacylglucosamine pyrophosphatase LpxH
VPGNHDENIRDYHSYIFGDIVIRNSDVHTTLEGKKFLVVHGDEYDTIAQCHKWLAKLGSDGYDFLIWINRFLRIVRRWFGLKSNFSLAAFVKFKVKNVVQFISDYEEGIVNSLKDQKLDGVICGHIHHAEIKEINGFLYINTGDFVESCTAIVEHFDGAIELIKWEKVTASAVEEPMLEASL